VLNLSFGHAHTPNPKIHFTQFHTLPPFRETSKLAPHNASRPTLTLRPMYPMPPLLQAAHAPLFAGSTAAATYHESTSKTSASDHAWCPASLGITTRESIARMPTLNHNWMAWLQARVGVNQHSQDYWPLAMYFAVCSCSQTAQLQHGAPQHVCQPFLELRLLQSTQCPSDKLELDMVSLSGGR
jgi:hypothetical protein